MVNQFNFNEPLTNVNLTPVEKIGNIFVKRDDLYEIAGAHGGKARTAWFLSRGAKGLITAGSRSSPQIAIVAKIAEYLDIPCRAHTTTGELGTNLQGLKATIFQHKPGYNSVIIARAQQDAREHREMKYIPFGMECQEAVYQTSLQVTNIPIEVKRIVIPIGSGMSACGVLWGNRNNRNLPVVGIVTGANPRKRLDRYAPPYWDSMLTLIKSDYEYEQSPKNTYIGNLELDPIYESKCLPYLIDGDLLWIVGIR
jgi:1-aminocyclopropane-1-carboxylate deaminase/D-cysteine desulfhydrase-like pyridoxal-dependent ACC family enzyme